MGAGGGFKLKKINFNKSIDTKARNKKLFVKLFRNHLCQEEKFFFDRKIEEKYISKYFSKNYLASKMKKAKQDFFNPTIIPKMPKSCSICLIIFGLICVLIRIIFLIMRL